MMFMEMTFCSSAYVEIFPENKEAILQEDEPKNFSVV